MRSAAIRLVLLALLLPACAASPHASPGAAAHKPTQWAEGNYIINLYDAFGPKKAGLKHHFGFSALIRYQGKTILFDSGTNADVFKANTEALGIDLRDVDFAVASHAHFDHINGFDYLLQVNPDVKIFFPKDMWWGANADFSVAGPEAGAADALPPEQRYFAGEKEDFQFDQSGRFWNANVEYVDSNTEIAPGITLIATTSPFMGYFTRYPSHGGVEGLEEKGESDIKAMELPELSLNLETPDGDVLVVGCSHSMVETIVRATRQHLERPIGLVYGGYHLLPYTSDEIRTIAARMKEELGVVAVAPAHCTGHAGFKVFREVFAEHYQLAGLGTVVGFPGSNAPTLSPTKEAFSPPLPHQGRQASNL